ncbi:MAG: insulinase family protein [Gammaproteobacteria bacterium]|nr:insulinase family protein [Gammaproteobacteria bacterium]
MSRPCFLLALLLWVGQAAAQGVALPDNLSRVQLDNGIVLILSEKHDVPLIGLRATLRGGAVTDAAGKAGLASLLGGLLEKGAGDRDAAAFAETIAAAGGSLSVSAELESLSVAAEFLARDADLMVELVADMLQRPKLDSGEMRRLRDRRINLIRAAKDGDPRRLIATYGKALLFGEHPYGNAINGDENSLQGISHRDVLAYYKNFVGADRLIIAVVGDFDTATMTESLTAAFSAWRPAAAALPELAAPVPATGRRVLLIDKPGATQSYFWIGNVGVAANFPQRAELDIANTLFGGRFTSLLMTELRTSAGLTYDARSELTRASLPGSVAIVSSTDTASTVAAIDMALALLTRIHDQSFSDDMISSGKNYVLGQFPMELETAPQLASLFADLEVLGLDASYIENYGGAVASVVGEELRSVIDAVYPETDNLVFAIIGDAELVRDEVAKYGPVTEIAITEARFRP